MKYIYFKKSGQVRKVADDNKRKIAQLKDDDFEQFTMDKDGKITFVGVTSKEDFDKVVKYNKELISENDKLKKELKTLKNK